MPGPGIKIDIGFMNVTAIGRTEILYDTIVAVHAAGHVVDRIITCGAEDFYGATESDFERLATEVNAEFHFTEDLNAPAMVDRLTDSPSEVAVSVNWKYPIHRQVLDAFEHGILNAHSGDLPRYRGNAAPNWAIINGENEVVLTIHRMTEEIDAGPIFRQASVPLTEDTYLSEVYEAMQSQFPELFVETLSGLKSGELSPRPQPDDPTEVLRGYPRIPKDSEIDWMESARHIHRVVRASAEPLFGAFTYLGVEELTVWRARFEYPEFQYCGTPGQVAERRPEEGEVAVVTGDGFLVLEEVQLEDGERVPATDVISSIRTRLGMDEQAEIRRLNAHISEIRAGTDESGD